MPRGDLYLGALDLGSHELKMLIAKFRDDGFLEIISFANGHAHGIERGMIIDFTSAVRSIKNVVHQAEHMAGRKIEHLVVGIGGPQIYTATSNGSIKITDGVVSQQDIDTLLDSTLSYFNVTDKQLLHNIPSSYVIDQQESHATRTPFGLSGKRLDVDTTIIHTNKNNYQTISRCLEASEIRSFVITATPISSAEAVMSKDDYDLGVCVIDYGATLTQVSVFAQGSLRALKSIQLGGNTVTRDIALATHVPSIEAEQLKKELSSKKRNELSHEEKIILSTERSVSPHYVLDIIDSRVREILEFARHELHQSGYADVVGSGLILMGGACDYPATMTIAEDLFQMPARGANLLASEIDGVETIDKKKYIQALGLLVFYHRETSKEEDHGFHDRTNLFKDLFTWIK